MTTQSTLVGAPTLPRVNLLPPEIAEARTLQQYRLGAAGAVIVACVAVGGLYMNAHSGVAGAQSALSTSEAKTTTLNTQLTQLNGVTQLKDQVAGAQATLATALAPQILWSHYLQDMSVALAGNYWFTTLALNNARPPATTPVADSTAVGSASVTGKAVNQSDVARLLEALSKEKGFSVPTLSSSVEDTAPVVGTSIRLVTFSAQASIDSTGKPAAVVPPTSVPATAPTPAGH